MRVVHEPVDSRVQPTLPPHDAQSSTEKIDVSARPAVLDTATDTVFNADAGMYNSAT